MEVRINEMWWSSCAQLMEFDVIVTAKAEEIASLKEQHLPALAVTLLALTILMRTHLSDGALFTWVEVLYREKGEPHPWTTSQGKTEK